MKFTVKVAIQTELNGLDLDSEYDRLGFEDDEDCRPEVFPARYLTVEVSKEFAKAHRNIFEDGSTVAVIPMELTGTQPGDWIEYGTYGMQLNKDAFTEDRLASLI